MIRRWSRGRLFTTSVIGCLLLFFFHHVEGKGYGEVCSSNDDCPAPHQSCNDSRCSCVENYHAILYSDTPNSDICRPIYGGALGSYCDRIADCNFRILDVVCEEQKCMCTGGPEWVHGTYTCNNKGYSGVFMKTVMSLCAVVTVVFAGVLIYRYVTRSSLSKPIKWLHYSSHVDLRWPDYPTLRRSVRNSIRRLSIRRRNSAAPVNSSHQHRENQAASNHIPSTSDCDGIYKTVVSTVPISQPPPYQPNTSFGVGSSPNDTAPEYRTSDASHRNPAGLNSRSLVIETADSSHYAADLEPSSIHPGLTSNV